MIITIHIDVYECVYEFHLDSVKDFVHLKLTTRILIAY